MSRQMHRRVLPTRPTEEAARRERTLRLAFVKARSALGCRPEPRSAFDKPASDEDRRPWRGFAEPLRATARAAAHAPEATRIQTEALLVGAVGALLDYILEPLEKSAGDVCYIALVKEQAEAIDAQSRARMLQTPELRARAVHETAEAINVSRLYVAAERATMPEPRPPLVLA